MEKYNIKTEETLYIRILVWAYKKQEAGFSMEELEKEFNLNIAQKEWVLKVFRSNITASDNLIDLLSYNDSKKEHLYVITSKGTAAAIEYLNLVEAKISSGRAEKIALVAIAIGVTVGAIQIIIALCK